MPSFKITQLPSIETKDITNNDWFVVSRDTPSVSYKTKAIFFTTDEEHTKLSTYTTSNIEILSADLKTKTTDFSTKLYELSTYTMGLATNEANYRQLDDIRHTNLSSQVIANTTAISTLSTKSNTLTLLSNAFANQITTLSSSYIKLDTSLGQLNNTTTVLATNVRSLSDEATKLKTNTNFITSTIENFNSAQRTFNSNVTADIKLFKTVVPLITSNIKNLQRDVDDLDNEITNINTGSIILRNAVRQLTADFEAFKTSSTKKINGIIQAFLNSYDENTDLSPLKVSIPRNVFTAQRYINHPNPFETGTVDLYSNNRQYNGRWFNLKYCLKPVPGQTASNRWLHYFSSMPKYVTFKLSANESKIHLGWNGTQLPAGITARNNRDSYVWYLQQNTYIFTLGHTDRIGSDYIGRMGINWTPTNVATLTPPTVEYFYGPHNSIVIGTGNNTRQFTVVTVPLNAAGDNVWFYLEGTDWDVNGSHWAYIDLIDTPPDYRYNNHSSSTEIKIKDMLTDLL